MKNFTKFLGKNKSLLMRVVLVVVGMVWGGSVFAASITSSGTGNWSASAWPTTNRTGTITATTSTTTVTGSGTSFTTQFSVGNILSTQAGVAIGTIASIESNTSLTLTANSSNNASSATFRGQGVGSGDAITIAASHIVTIDGSYSCSSLALAAASTLAFQNSTKSLSVSGAITMAGSSSTTKLNVGAGTLSASSLTLGKGASSSISEVILSTGTLTISGQTDAAGTGNGDKITFTGNGTFSTGSLTNISTFTSSTGTFKYTGATCTVLGVAYNNLELIGSGTYVMSSSATYGGTLTLGGTVTTTSVAAMSLGGLVVNSGATLTIAAGNNISVSGTTSVTGTLKFNAVSSATANFTGAVTINSGGILEIGGASSPSFTFSAGLTYATGSTLKYTKGSANVTSTSNEWTTTSVPYNVNIVMTTSAYTVTLSNNARVSGVLTLTGGTLLVGSNTLTLSGSSPVVTSGDISVVSGTIVFTNTSQITLPTAFFKSATNVQNFTMNGTGGVILQQAITIAGTLTLTSGVLTTTSTYLPTVSNTANTGVSGGSTTSYVNGPLKWNMATSSSNTYVFPVGKGSLYLPFSFDTYTATTPTLQVEAFASFSGGSISSPANTFLGGEYWSVIYSANAITNGYVSLGRPSGLGNKYRIASSTSQAGVYTDLNGVISSTTIRGSTSIGSLTPAPQTRYYAMVDNTSCSTYSGTISVGPTGTFSSLTYAISRLKTCGYSGNLVLELQSTYDGSNSETFPIDFTPTSNFVPSSSKKVTIRPASGVSSTLTISGSSTSQILKFDGTDYVTFDGRPGGTGSSKFLTITNTSTSTGGSAITFINDATYDTIKYCNLKSSYTSASSGVVIFSTTTGSTGNDNNVIDYCVIDGNANNPSTGTSASPTAGVATNGIYSDGTGTTEATKNSNNTISNSEFKDVWVEATSNTPTFIYLKTNNTAWNISGNSFYQTSDRTATGARTFYGMNIGDGNGYTISGNYFGGSAASASGNWVQSSSGSNYTIFYGINLAVGTTTTTSVQNNTFKGMTWDIKGSYPWAAIYITSGNVNVGTSTGNTIGATTGTSSLQFINTTGTPLIYGIYSSSTGTVSIRKNNISSLSTCNCAQTFKLYGIYTSGAAGIYTISSNNIGSASAGAITMGGATTAANVLEFYGIYNSATGVTKIDSNTIKNVIVYGTGASALYPIYNTAGAATSSINNNTISTLSNASTGTTGINTMIYNSANSLSISNNSISAITLNNNGTFKGIYSTSTGAVTISGNSIGGVSTANVAQAHTAYGIQTAGTAGVFTISSNIIGSRTVANSIQLGGTSTGANICTFYGIHNAATGVTTISSDTIQNVTVYGTGTSVIYPIYNTNGAATSSISSNIISTLSNASSGSTGISTMIYNSAAAQISISSNSIRSITIANGQFIGIHDNVNATGNTHTISSNTIGSNISISSSSTSDIAGIYIGNAGTYSIVSNNIKNITHSGAVAATLIGIDGVGGATYYIDGNTVDSLSCSSNTNVNSVVYGIAFKTNVYNSASTVTKNKLTNFKNLSTGNTNQICGIYNYPGMGGTTLSLYNNFFDCNNEGNDNKITIYGISHYAGGNTNLTAYHNTIKISGSTTDNSGYANSSCFYTAVGGTLLVKNNIFYNSRTSGATNKNYVYQNTASYQTGVDNNYYYNATNATFANTWNGSSGVDRTSSTFNGSGNYQGGATPNSVYATSSPIAIASDGSLLSAGYTTVGSGVDLSASVTDDIRGSAREDYTKGCYEGLAMIYYSRYATSNTDANTLANWTTKRNGSGSTPSNFTSESKFKIQSGHKYQVTSSWTGHASSIIYVESGGALDINAQTISTWSSLNLAGSGVSSTSGALISTGSSTVSLPVVLSANTTISSTSTGNLSLSGTLTNGGYTLTVNGTNNTTISGVISGTGSVTKSGTGILTLSGTNTYSGGSTVSAGTLAIGDNAGLGTGTLTISGGFLDASGADRTIINPMSIGADFTFIGSYNLTQNIGDVGLASSPTITVSANNFTINGVISNSGTTSTTITQTGSGTWPCPIGVSSINIYAWGAGGGGGASNASTGGGGGGGGAFAYKNNYSVSAPTGYTYYVGVGGVGGSKCNSCTIGVATNGEDTYFYSNTTVLAKGGKLGANTGGAGGAGGLGSACLPVMSTNGGTGASLGNVNYAIGGGGAAGSGVSGVGSSGSNGTVPASGSSGGVGGSGTYPGGTGGDGTAGAGSNGSPGTQPGGGGGGGKGMSASSTGGGGNGGAGQIVIEYTTPRALSKNGAGTLTLGGINTFTNGFTLSAGTLNINNASALGASSGTFTINGGTINNTFGSIINMVNYPMSWAGDFTFTGSNELNMGSGEVALTATRQVTVSSNTLTVGGIISGSTFGLTKLGTGKLTFTGVNTYTSTTTVSAGTLALSGSGSIASTSNFIVATAASVDISAKTSGVSLATSQTLTISATGSNTTASITVASSKDYTLGSSGTLTFSSYGGGATPPLTITGSTAGSFVMNGAPVTVTTSTALGTGTYILVDKASSATGVTGSAGALTIGGSGLASNCTASISVTANQLVLVVIGPTITLGSNPVAAASSCASTSKVPIQSFTLAVTGGAGNLTNVSFTTSGTYAQSDIANFKIWYGGTTNDLSAVATPLATLSPPTGGFNTTETFTAFTSPTLNSGSTYYFWITMDVAASPTDNATLTVSALTTDNLTSTSTKVLSTNAAGGTQTLNALPSITTHPSAATICYGGDYSPSVAASGGVTLSYQWQFATSLGGSYSDVTNSTPASATFTNNTTATLTQTGNIAQGSGYYYRCVVSSTGNGCSSVTSTPAQLTINADPTIDTPPSAVTECIGGTDAMSVSASGGTPSLSYQWYSNGASSNSGGTSIGSATSSSYTVPSSSAGTTYYYVVVSASGSGCTSATSSAVAGNIIADPTIGTQPLAVTECIGGTDAMSVSASDGTPSLSYQWYSNGSSSNSGGTSIGSATSSSYTVPSSSAGTTYYYVVVSASGSGCTSATSSAVAGNIIADPTIGTQPLAVTECIGGTDAMSVSASDGTPSLSYQWYSNGSSSNSGGTSIGSATSSSYTVPSSSAGTTYYYVVVSASGSGCTSATSSAVAGNINADPTWATNTVTPVSICSGGDVTFSATVSGGLSNTITWTRATSTGGVGSTVTSPNTEASATTAYYRPVYTSSVSGCNLADGTETPVTINARPSTAVLAGTTSICNGSSANLIVTVTGGTSPYSVVYSGGTVSSYTSASNISVSPITNTTYTLTSVTDANGCTATTPSGSAVITVTTLPTATISYAGSPFTTNQGAGQAVTLSGDNTGSFSSTSGLTIDVSTGAINPSSSTVGGYTVTYTIPSSGGCGSVVKTTTVTINTGSTVFYYVGTGDIDNVTNWTANSNGTTGDKPGAMNTSGCTFYIYHYGTTTPTLNSTLNLGTGSKIVVGNGTDAVNFTVPHTITVGTIDVSNNATLTLTNSTIPTLGTLASGSTVKFSGSGGAQIIPTGTFGNLEINNSSGVSAAVTLAVNGNLTLTSGAFTPSVALTIAGNFVDNGGTFTHNNGTVTFTGSNASIGGTDNAETFYNVVVNKTAGQTLSSSGNMATISCAGTFTQTQGNFTAPATMNITGATTLTAGTFTAPSGVLTVSDNFTNNGASFTHNSGTVIMSGASKTLGGTSGNTFYNLTANGATTLGIAQTVNHTMTLGAKLTLSSNNLTIGSSGYFSGYSSDNFVVTNTTTGKVIQNGIESTSSIGKQIFPIGTTTVAGSTKYTPCTIANSGTSDNFSVYVAEGRLGKGTTGTASTSHTLDRTWFIDEASIGGSDVTLTLQWNASEELTSFTRTNSYISHYTGGIWDKTQVPGNALAVGSIADAYSLTRAGISSFSPFSVEDPSALPITLIDFTAKAAGKKIRLDWETGTEENNDYFTIERSLDGKHFEHVFTKKGAGNSKVNQYYFGYDASPYKDISYYRLKQTDFDGKYVYSDIISVNLQGENMASELNLKVYPNPVSNQLIHVDLDAQNNAKYTMSIINEIGQQIFTDSYDALVGNNSYEIHLPNVVPGMYVLEIRNDKDIVVEHVKISVASVE